MRGRPRKPAHQRRLEGNPGKRPIREEPEGVKARPRVPDTLLTDEPVAPEPLGGGWYLLGDGTKVQGKANAEAAASPPVSIAALKFEEICDRLEEFGALQLADAHVIEITAAAYAEWVELRQEVEEVGYTYRAETQHGFRILANPAVAAMGQAWNRYQSGLAKCGLTPADRSRLPVKPPEAEDDPLEAALSSHPPRPQLAK